MKRMDDLMDATRYAYQSLRFADIKPIPRSFNTRTAIGVRNW